MKKVNLLIAISLSLAIVFTGFILLKPITPFSDKDPLQLQQMNDTVEILKKENTSLKNHNNQLTRKNDDLLNQLNENDKERLSQLTEATGLMNVQDIDNTLILDLRYATDNNFVGQKVYSVAICLLQKDTALKLKHANELAKKDGYRIKIWDGYRPLDAQKVFWEKVPDPRYVSDPSKGTDHNRGVAVDVTLVDQSGKELEMPTGFDEFTEKAGRNYQGNTPEAQKNMEYLTRIMQQSGFTTIRTEWWHFKDTNEKNYPFQNVKLEYFVPKKY